MASENVNINILSRTSKDDMYSTSYNLLGQKISICKEENNIGVVIDEDLSFEKHICKKVNKAYSIFAEFLPLYKTFVRTHLDYASSE